MSLVLLPFHIIEIYSWQVAAFYLGLVINTRFVHESKLLAKDVFATYPELWNVFFIIAQFAPPVGPDYTFLF